MALDVLVIVAYILWFIMETKVLRSRRLVARLSRNRYLRYQRLKEFRFHQKQRFFALVGIMVCTLTRTCRIFLPRSVWVKERSADWWVRVVNGTWTEKDWRENFRMCKETFNYLCDELSPAVIKRDTRYFAYLLLLQAYCICQITLCLLTLQGSDEPYLLPRGLPLHCGDLLLTWSIEQSAICLALGDQQPVKLSTKLRMLLHKLFFHDISSYLKGKT